MWQNISFSEGLRHLTLPTVLWRSHGNSGAGRREGSKVVGGIPGQSPRASESPPVPSSHLQSQAEEAEGEPRPVRCPQASCKESPAATPGGGSLAVSYPPPTRSPCWPLLTVFTRTALLQFAKHFFHSLSLDLHNDLDVHSLALFNQDEPEAQGMSKLPQAPRAQNWGVRPGIPVCARIPPPWPSTPD